MKIDDRQVAVVFGDPRLPDRTKVEHRFAAEDLDSMRQARQALAGLTGYRLRFLDDHTRLFDDLRADAPELVLNFCDTGFRNDATRELHVPALCELLALPYSGAGPACLVRCFDKTWTRALAAALGIPVPKQQLVLAGHDSGALELPFPAIVKPNQGDGSFGITQHSVVKDHAQATAQIEALRQQMPGADLIVQEFLDGPEYGVTLLGNPGLGIAALPVLTVDYRGLDPELPPILGYESKTLPDSPYWQKLRFTRAPLGASTVAEITGAAERLFHALHCRDYARFDFRADRRGAIKLLEVNPNPAWCWDGKMNLMAAMAGWSYGELLGELLKVAFARVDAGGSPDRH